MKVDEDIPAFDVVEQDLGLCNRKFTTGTIIKLYSYDLPAGSRSVISRDLNQSINEYLFEPVLPAITVDKKERYPDDRNLERDLYGLNGDWNRMTIGMWIRITLTSSTMRSLEK